jgi:hypothetical protein
MLNLERCRKLVDARRVVQQLKVGQLSGFPKAAKNAKQVGLTRDHSHTTHMTYGRQAYSFVDKDWIDNWQVGVQS